MKYLLTAALAAFVPALASAAPVFLPSRDVVVDYTLAATGQVPENYQFSYNATDQLARVDSPTGFYILVNLPAAQAEIVLPALHAIVQAPDFSVLTKEIYHANDSRFSPLGTGYYAGLACRKYLVTNQHGTARACITHNGVILHFVGQDAHGGADVTATSVSFVSQPPGQFAIPEGFAPLSLPRGAVQALLQPRG